MKFGVPREMRQFEYRVGLTPPAVHSIIGAGHQVFVESGTGMHAGFRDQDYEYVGAAIMNRPLDVWEKADVVVKVARPAEQEYVRFQKGHTLFSFMHLAVASRDLIEALSESEMTTVAYETIQTDDGTTPVLLSVSEVTGRLAPILAGELLESAQGGKGILLSGIPGTAPAVAVILGAGVLGSNAARMFFNYGAQVLVLDRNIETLQRIEALFEGKVPTLIANPFNIAKAVGFADVLVCAVAVPGERAPLLVSREMVRSMRPGAVILDFSIDNGGCVETSRPTTLINPSFLEEGVVHYCVPNVPALVSRTSSYAISNAILPFLISVGEMGVDEAIRRLPELGRGVNLYRGKLAHARVAKSMGREVEIKI